ncbi:type I-E CRISPR-associated protein Cas7/Cse4/CasC [Streptomyces scopuliridis]|uniref:Type I-E CRISPR-associated protein Cas7/Cse4/CasC n=1 Tax=Streptomyces scopuliridis TaxID=452529 RepID=A0ACD4ZTS9_9ACTN|nr:type I-E CRISPR-associated protein Cas7/Cse4/CasC [Streptomyces scopuliridis]WSC01696.1 type I-E CRISPR-associated protein Cas7/Cse4/CasC [Streptomyces scopuliridis]WSC04765.1 type I-E CRISPR-associated protein Cas7/Cse4/CasC [Streptomyces scopuliridis]
MTATDLAPADTSIHPAIDTTRFPGPVVVVHSLTTLTGVCLNRDRDGLPKLLNCGAAERMRVSPQALIRPARMRIREQNSSEAQAARSRILPTMTAQALTQRGFDPSDALPAAVLIVAAAGLAIDLTQPGQSRTLVYVPQPAPGHLADLLEAHWEDLKDARIATEDAIAQAMHAAAPPEGDTKRKKGKPPLAGSLGKLVPAPIVHEARKAFAPALTEIALFGRMLTEIPNGTVRSAVNVAHAFTVDPVDLLTDDFTGVDDWQTDGVAGAGMLGAVYLASGTLYRYASLDRRTLRDNLARSGATTTAVENAAQLAERQFVTAITYTLPAARSTRTGSATWPTLAIAASADYALTASPAFETPLEPPAGVKAAERLADYLRRTGNLRGGIARWISPGGEKAPQLPNSLTLEDS